MKEHRFYYDPEDESFDDRFERDCEMGDYLRDAARDAECERMYEESKENKT